MIDIPQSGERFDRNGMRELQRNFPGGVPDMSLKRLAGSGDVWVAELAEPFKPPQQRAQWTRPAGS